MKAADSGSEDYITSSNCDHEEIEWGDGLRDEETGIIEDPDYLGICKLCDAWMVIYEDGSIESV